MDFKQITYIIKVAECRNITKAARELYISQPSLSQLISKAEEELGIRIFDRNTNPLTLTYAGKRYIEEAKKIIDINENIKKELQDIAGCQKGLIVLGIPRKRGFRQDKMSGRVFGCDRLGEDPGSALCSVKTGSREPEDLRRDLCEIRFFSQDPAGDKQQSDSFADGGRGSRGGDRAGDDDPSVPGKQEI